MLRDIFYKCGIIDKDGNMYVDKDCEPDTYKYCYGTPSVATERGLEIVKDGKASTPNGTRPLLLSCVVHVYYTEWFDMQYGLAFHFRVNFSEPVKNCEKRVKYQTTVLHIKSLSRIFKL